MRWRDNGILTAWLAVGSARTGSLTTLGDCGPPVIAGTRAGLPKINPFPLSWANAAYAVWIRGRPTMTSTR